MTKVTTQRIKVPKEHFDMLIEDAKNQFGQCSRATVFDALAFRTYSSEMAMYIRKVAQEKYNGVLIKEEKVV